MKVREEQVGIVKRHLPHVTQGSPLIMERVRCNTGG